MMLTDVIQIVESNQEKFAAVRALNLPLGQYFITGSGALGVRYLRRMNDIDLIVLPHLFQQLSQQYPAVQDGELTKISFSDGVVEAFTKQDVADISRRIAEADLIDGLPFDSLQNLLTYKKFLGREKDLKDIVLIEKALGERPLFEARAVVSSFAIVERVHAVFKARYAFLDKIYELISRHFDLNREYVRLRIYPDSAELTYKVASKVVFRHSFKSPEEAYPYLTDFKYLLSYSRTGRLYECGEAKIYAESIEGLPPSIEIAAPSKTLVDALFKEMGCSNLLSSSVPKLVSEKLVK